MNIEGNDYDSEIESARENSFAEYTPLEGNDYDAEIEAAKQESFDEAAYGGNSPMSASTLSSLDKNSSRPFKVQLSCGRDVVVFEASVPVNESRSVNYDSYGIVQLPTDIWSFRNTSSRRFSINGNLVSRNPSEASQNAKYIDLIRSWALPDFGGSGATPPILRLTAYGNNNINGVQVILNSYNIQFPETIDYIFQGTTPIPVIMPVTIELSEAYSPRQITNKEWKLNISKGGAFMYGVGATAAPGSVGSGDSIMNLASNGNFQGIASMDLPTTVTAENALGGSAIGDVAPSSETPNNAETMGVETDSSGYKIMESGDPNYVPKSQWDDGSQKVVTDPNSGRTYYYDDSKPRKATDYPFDSEEEMKAFQSKMKRKGL